MPRCRGRTRTGRQCRRQSLKGSTRCSLHMPKLVMGNSKSPGGIRSSSPRGKMTPSIGTTGASHPSHKGYYRTIRNTRFGVGDMLRHVYTDKVGDLSRTVGTAAAVNTVLAPITPYMIGLGPKGVAARAALGIGGTLAISGPMQTLDMYRDAYQFFRTGEIGGKRIYSHEYVTM